MRINLCEIIEMPGKSLPFSCEMETERLDQPAIAQFVSAPKASGVIKNTAGALSLTGEIHAELICVCDLCGSEFPCEMTIPLDAKLAADFDGEDDPEIFPLDGNELDLGDVLETCFILGSETSFLCSEDCAGLCPRCGKNLNEGSCSCGKEIDPRLAVLQQLLDKDE